MSDGDRSGPREPLTPIVPGSSELLDIAMKVNGNQESIKAIATRWRGAAGKVNEHAGELLGAVNTVNNAWQGQSADAFDTHMRKYGKAGDALHDALANCANSLDTAAEALNTAESEVNTLTTNLVTQWNTYCTNNPKQTDEERTAGIKPSVDQAVIAARGHLGKANAAVTQAVADLKKHLDERSITFEDIPAPGDEKFTPTPGYAFDWQRTPGYEASPKGGGGHGGSGGHGGGSGGGAGGFGGYGPSGPPPPGGGPEPEGKVKGWIEEAIKILKEHGYPVEKMNPSDIWMIIQHESGGDPNAINNWDSNAAAGTPSKGLMQTIDPTFDSYKLPGHGNIYNPVDNIIAGVRYAISRYGSVSNVPGVVGTKTGSGYVGY
ncbi:transglycosylase SLT domain-containing protein [Streptosporangium sp. NPDC000396]|uniref:transglycosylase SLT domain-containing protein n=1 Tax=Streptosporangium sp. NPDC000396 TaxID=3366185 RepID=UPI0036A94C37